MRTLSLWITHLFVFTIAFEDLAPIPGVGSMTRLAGFVVIGCWLGTLFIERKVRRPHFYLLIFSVYVLWQIATIFWTIDLSLTAKRIETYVQLLLMIVVLWDLYLQSSHLRIGLQAYVLGSYIYIISTFVNFAYGISFANSGRYSATGVNPNGMGVSLTLAIPAAWYLILHASKTQRFSRLLLFMNYGYIPLAIFAIVLTASRTSLLSLVPAALYILISLKKINGSLRIGIACLILVCLVFVQQYVPTSILERLNETGDSLSSGDLTGRTDIWRQGWAVFMQQPWIGIGSGAFIASVPLHQAPHNVYLAIATETGMIGFALLLLIWATLGLCLIYNPNKNTLFWGTILCIWLISASVSNSEFQKMTWLFFTWIVSNSNTLDPRRVEVSEYPR